MSKILVSVTNDLVTDQRVDKMCTSLTNMGFKVTLIGRKKRKSLPLTKREYKTSRMKLLFEKGPLFYMEYNIRLFLYLMAARKSTLIVSNDLDTLLACKLASWLKRIPLVYDSHEYYCYTPELINRPRVQNIWLGIEKRIFPGLIDIITVNNSIANLYENTYGKKLHVVRNIPRRAVTKTTLTRKDLGLPENKFIIIVQGAGINIDRGVEELVESMILITPLVSLLIVGSGDVIHIIKQRVKELNLNDRVIFVDTVPMDKLLAYSVNSNLGVTLDKNSNPNYYYSLPNKLFDYIRAGLPILASRLPEIEKIITTYNIGTFILDHDPKNIAKAVNSIVEDKYQYEIWKKNLAKADEELCWENEEKSIVKIYEKYRK